MCEIDLIKKTIEGGAGGTLDDAGGRKRLAGWVVVI